MKNFVLFLLIILVGIITIFMGNAFVATLNSQVVFTSSGYILNYEAGAEKYYFDENTKYKTSYNDQVVFKDTDGEQIVLNKDNFVHYNDESISSFTKGALVNLDNIETDPITYYNFSANKILKKLGNNQYIAKNLDQELDFSNFIWKISSTKFLIVGNNMKILFADDTMQDLNGYIELEYIDNEIVKIFNKDVLYETISSDVYLLIGENIKINLGTKIIYKEDSAKMSLENMVIDSNDNVNIVDLDEYKESEEENKDTNSVEQNGSQGGTATANAGGNVNANGGTAINVGTDTVDGNTNTNNGNTENDNNNSNTDNKISETEIDNALSVLIPKYIVKEFEVTATGLKAKVEIEDSEARLVSGTTTSIINNTTGKIVYNLPETGATQIKIDIDSLEPDTEYTFIMEASYAIDTEEYRNYFIYKIFRTSTLGITLEKDLFTSSSLSFNLKFDGDSTVTKVDAELVEVGQKIENIQSSNGGTEKIEFMELEPDTEYTLRIYNIFVNNTSNDNSYSYKFKTLKETPKFEDKKTHCNVDVVIDKWNSMFILSIPEIESETIQNLEYQIFTQTEGNETLVYSKNTLNTNLNLKISDTIKRNTEYYCRVYATYYDNEKIVEYEIANTESSFNMNSSEMPSVRFETGTDGAVTFNSIKGQIVIDDEGKTINYRTAKIDILYSSTTKGVDDAGTISFDGISDELVLPINIKELKSNETYNFNVYATYDLNDGNGSRYGYIGSVIVTTKNPIPMNALWTAGDDGININLQFESTEESTLEAESLYSFNLSLYLGQEGASKDPIATTTIVDRGIDSFAGTLKENYYDTQGLISKATFNLTDSELEDIQRENTYCTIVLSDAKDYVSRNDTKNFENNLPVLSNTHTYLIQEFKNMNPSNSIDSIKTEQISKSKIQTTTYTKLVTTNDYTSVSQITNNNNINGSTIVGIKLSANMSTIQLNSYNYFEFYVYNQNKELVAESGMIQKNVEETNAPSALFLISNGTEYSIEDEYLARGNTYYYKYYAYASADKEEKYPSDEDGEDYWDVNTMPSVITRKQEPIIIMYPSESDRDSITYKYRTNDIDNAIEIINDNKYFYNFYAGVEIYKNNKKVLQEGSSPEDNGFWTVKFDGLQELNVNYNLETKVLRSTHKNEQLTYKNLTYQKLENILNSFTIITTNSIEDGISQTISFDNLQAEYKEKIAKIQLELVDTDGEISDIVIEKNVNELNNSNWQFELNYLDIIYSKKNDVLKNKTFNINAKIYYINGITGYDSIDDYVSYQTIGGNWLRIYSNMEFAQVNNSGVGYPIVYENHNYVFGDNRVNIFKDSDEISWFNYSENGLIRTIGSQDNVAILPKKVLVNNLNNIQELSLNNVIPGVKSSDDLKIIAGPTYVTLSLNKTYSKDTINSEGEYNVYADIYELDGNELISTVQIGSEATTVTGLINKRQYYFNLYIVVNNQKYYLYDINKNIYKNNYYFSSLGEVTMTNIDFELRKDSREKGYLIIRTGASVETGFNGLKYEILHYNGTAVTEEIFYSVDNENFESTTNGKFSLPLSEFTAHNTTFGKIYIDTSRGSFFEYETRYIVKITPYIINNEEEEEAIGETISAVYSYKPMIPEVLLYAKRVKALDDDESYIEWTISTYDEDYLIANDTINYSLYINGDTNPIKTGNVEYSDYISIITSKATIGDTFELESAYRLEIYYDYYTSNVYDTSIERVDLQKKLAKVENGISVGAISWEIIDSSQIKMKFYDSYELDKVQAIKCSIYDTSGRILKNVPTIENISIIDQSSDTRDPHKSITFNPEYIFETATSYIISVKFLDGDGNELAIFEPESPVTNE